MKNIKSPYTIFLFGYSSHTDGKVLLLKTAGTYAIEHGKFDLVFN